MTAAPCTPAELRELADMFESGFGWGREVAGLRALAEQLEGTTASQYAHMCRDGHVQIGYNESGDDERCPLCLATDYLVALLDEPPGRPHSVVQAEDTATAESGVDQEGSTTSSRATDARDATFAAYLAASREYGEHSRIPACCVAAYCADDAAGIRGIGAKRDEEMGYRFPGPACVAGAEYVPCRGCYQRIVAGEPCAAIHTCDRERDPECARVRDAYDAAYFAMREAHPERAVAIVVDLAVDPSRSTPAPAVAVPHPLAPQPDDTTRDASPHRGACPQ